MAEHEIKGSRRLTKIKTTTIRTGATAADWTEFAGDLPEPESVLGKAGWDLEAYERVAKDRLAAAGYPNDIRKSYEKQGGRWVSVKDGIGLPKLLELDGHPFDSPLGYAAAVLEQLAVLSGCISGVIRHSVGLGKLLMKEAIDARYGELIEKAAKAREARQEAAADSELNRERKQKAAETAAKVKARWRELQKSPQKCPYPVAVLSKEFQVTERTIRNYLKR